MAAISAFMAESFKTQLLPAANQLWPRMPDWELNDFPQFAFSLGRNVQQLEANQAAKRSAIPSL
jgi:hypothetical protein